MNRFHLFWFLLVSIGAYTHSNAQSYLKSLSEPETSFRQKITTFKNGDILIGDSAFEGSFLFLTRMDKCGLVVWSNTFEVQGLQLDFKDFVVNEQDQIFVYGSALDDFRELTFLMEVDDMGNQKDFRAFNSGAASSSAFSLDWQNDQLLLLGRLLEIGASTTGFFAIFDTDLNFQWGKKINPFSFEGKGIITANGDLVARSKALHYKFSSDGTLQWAKEFELSLDPIPLAGPIEVQNGYLFEAIHQNKIFFYVLDSDGEIVWKSPLFTSTPFPAAMHRRLDGELVIHYSNPKQLGNSLTQLRLSPTGQPLEHLELNYINSFNIGSIAHAFGPDGQLNILGNNDALTSPPADITDYLMQFSVDAAAPSCFDWQPIQDTLSNAYPLSFPPIENITISDLSMRDTFLGSIATNIREMPYFERCGATLEPIITTIDTFISCDESWSVLLPSESFHWVDNIETSPRLLSTPGIYQAKNNDCENPMIYEYQLGKALCDCQVFLPNAFSPNGDGQNDIIQLFTDCEIAEIETSVYDRWGNLIHQDQNLEEIWNGTFQQEEVAEGVYILVIDYTLLSDSGGEQKGRLAQEVLLLR